MPKTPAITNIRNLLPTLISKNLYAASVPAKAPKVPITAPDTTPSPNCASNTLLRPPSATPSRAQKASTSAGLTTRLNEFTIDSAKAPRLPTITASSRLARMPVSGVISGVRIHVASAVTITTASEMPVFWTTESIVIRPWSVVGEFRRAGAPRAGVRLAVARVAAVAGVGLVAVGVRAGALNPSDRRNTGLLLCMVSSLEAWGRPSDGSAT